MSTPTPSTPETTRITVAGDAPYDVLVGSGLLGELPGLLGERVQRVLVVHPRALAATGEAVREDLVAAGFEAYLAEVPDGEDAKRAEVAAFCWGVLGQSGFTRTDAVVGLGGGAVTDLAGFVAATWLRGVRVVQVPTTLLAMVDAAVGGKTGLNTAEGKNLVGAFHPPAGVLCDLDVLATLPRQRPGGGHGRGGQVRLHRRPARPGADRGGPGGGDGPRRRRSCAELVERAVRVKADVVGEDLRESGLREVLNYGHTLGHAIELVERYAWRHGAAVSVGMVFAAELARLAGRLGEAVVDRHRRVLGSLGLPRPTAGTGGRSCWTRCAATRRPAATCCASSCWTAWPARARLEGPDPSLLAAAYAEVSA